jgi:hypothetical protein
MNIEALCERTGPATDHGLGQNGVSQTAITQMLAAQVACVPRMALYHTLLYGWRKRKGRALYER